MSMQEDLPDDHLDELFRKSAEEFEPEFEPQAWAAMRKKLDNNEDVTAKPSVLRPALLLLLLLLFSVGGYLLWPRLTSWLNGQPSVNTVAVENQKPNNQPLKEQQGVDSNENTALNESKTIPKENTKQPSSTLTPADPPENNQPSASKELPVSENLSVPKVNSEKAKKIGSSGSVLPISAPSEVIKAKAGIKSKDSSGVNPTDLSPNATASSKISPKRNTSGDNTPASRTKERFSAQSAKTGRRPSANNPNPAGRNRTAYQQERLLSTGKNANVRDKDPERSSDSMAASATAADALAPLQATPRATFTPDALAAHPWELLKVTYAPAVVSYTPPPPLAIPQKPEISPVFKNGLSIRVIAAPDLSFIGFDQIIRPGTAIGAMLEYRFNRRFSLQAGAMRTLKLYNATGAQYIWPEAWNTQKARPESIEAACKVLDIPLNLRYDISQSGNKRWFVTSGITSYRMLNEKYTYHYPPRSYGIKWPNWDGSTGNYWFSVLNLSVGFERQLSKKITLQVEPYFKVPLGKVGLGKIKLNTSGIFITARYRLGRL